MSNVAEFQPDGTSVRNFVRAPGCAHHVFDVQPLLLPGHDFDSFRSA